MAEEISSSLSENPIKVPGAFRRSRSPPRNDLGQMFCDHVNCRGKVQTFKRVCEWNKHMDRHERPYKCREAGCELNPGFTYSGGLLRHQREVHKMHLSTKQPLFCPFSQLQSQLWDRFHQEGKLGRAQAAKALGRVVGPRRWRSHANNFPSRRSLSRQNRQRSEGESRRRRKHRSSQDQAAMWDSAWI